MNDARERLERAIAPDAIPGGTTDDDLIEVPVRDLRTVLDALSEQDKALERAVAKFEQWARVFASSSGTSQISEEMLKDAEAFRAALLERGRNTK